MPKATTFHPTEPGDITVTIMTPPNDRGMCVVDWDGVKLRRNVIRLTALDEDARKLMGRKP
jgi:hypothetical protein